MKRPRNRGTKRSAMRMRDWVNSFAGYRHQVNEGRIDRWLEQFRPDDRDLAMRILDSVEFISSEQVSAAYRSLLNRLDGWNIDKTKRQGKWRFVPYSGSAGESGDSMLHLFRIANGMSHSRYNELFIYRSELLTARLGPKDTVVFIDDFSGTGKQVCDNWPQFEELLPGLPRIYLLLPAAFITAREQIRNETSMQVLVHQEFTVEDNIFSVDCTFFSKAEKELIKYYCGRSAKTAPLGFGECGALIVFSHRCPNNTIPILHASHRSWEGLFRRND